ncbi:MAG TPA: molybdopterin-binding protein, partial [Egibacteraceae bacterium]|nr:molybdopterin-binding protein [Egibacteraceae bacterium]
MIRAVVVTVSTRAAAGAYDDAAGPAVAQELAAAGFQVGPGAVVPDGRRAVADALVAACASADLVSTAG